MANFTFSLGDKTVYAIVHSVRSSSFVTYRAYGKCPYCLQEMKVGYGMGDKKTEGRAKADLKLSMTKHYKARHK